MRENVTFRNATDKERVIILRYIQEEKLNLWLVFKNEAHGYLRKNYPDEYDTHLLGADKKIHLLCELQTVTNDDVTVIKKERIRGDATAYDDTSIQIWTCPSRPSGMTLTIPLSVIENINLLR